MNYKTIDLHGISYIEAMQGSSIWYWGSDYCSGDLYEAEELFASNHRVKCNRIACVKFPEGEIHEPIQAKEGQYLGTPVFSDGKIILLLVDFIQNEIRIEAYDPESKIVTNLAVIEKGMVKDCYNLLLRESPLYLARDDRSGLYEIIWPERHSFMQEDTEVIYKRENDKLVSSVWYEDPDYREEVLIRNYATGKILERLDGCLKEMPDGQQWLIK